MKPEDDHQVLFVSAGTPAADAGFIRGDLVESINGIAVEHLGDPARTSDLLRADAGTAYEVKIPRYEEPLELRLTLRELY